MSVAGRAVPLALEPKAIEKKASAESFDPRLIWDSGSRVQGQHG